MATLKEYFVTDFARWGHANVDYTLELQPSKQVVTVPVRVHEDVQAAAKFFSIYVPSPVDPLAAVDQLVVNKLKDAKRIGSSVRMELSFAGLPSQISSDDLVFTGRLFVYAEESVSQDRLNAYREHCRSKGLKVVLYDTHYSKERSRMEVPEAFICHDSRDKVEVAEPIASGLQTLLCPVWYDEFSLSIGDSLRESIEKGIREARKCIVIISPHFLSNSGWTKTEFTSIFTREMVERQRVILPVWHSVTEKDVYEYSPMLADRFAVSTSIGMEKVVKRLHAQLNQAT